MAIPYGVVTSFSVVQVVGPTSWALALMLGLWFGF